MNYSFKPDLAIAQEKELEIAAYYSSRGAIVIRPPGYFPDYDIRVHLGVTQPTIEIKYDEMSEGLGTSLCKVSPLLGGSLTCSVFTTHFLGVMSPHSYDYATTSFFLAIVNESAKRLYHLCQRTRKETGAGCLCSRSYCYIILNS